MRRLFPLALLLFCAFVWAVSCQEDARDFLPYHSYDLRAPRPDLVFSADLTRPADGAGDAGDGGDGGG